MPDASPNDDPQATPPGITYQMTKSPSFRIVHADGVWGGLTPQGGFHMAFFSERRSYPDSVSYLIDGEQLVESGRDGGDGFEREVETAIVMDVRTARTMLGWLRDRLSQVDALESLSSEGMTEK